MNTAYDNCELWSNIGTFLGYINKRRFDWYIKKGLAGLKSENAISLNFEPSYKREKIELVRETCQPKENKCVACGSETELRKFRIVPMDIKKLFPINIKAHKCDDIVVLCCEDVPDADYFANEFKHMLFEEYSIDVKNYKMTKQMHFGKSFVTTFLNNKVNNKDDANEFTIKKITSIFGRFPSDEEMKQYLIDLENKKHNGFKTPEEELVSYIAKNNDYVRFINRWKQNFVDTMTPMFLSWDFHESFKK